VANAMLGANSDLRKENRRCGAYSQLMAFFPGARADTPLRPFPLRGGNQLLLQLSRFSRVEYQASEPDEQKVVR
jgi:hypothetical protein